MGTSLGEIGEDGGFRIFGGSPAQVFVAGGGADRLRAASLSVIVGIEEAACQWQNRGYLRWLRCGRPQLLMKAAISLDGRLAPRTQPGSLVGPRWLTG